ncbi:hypothetical protein NPIL_243271 [Nephila pilipes]|uniref:Uncharacterized protein n=1 Tax=Nephila pilipes TaxID=299642 RepID=A0A8X6K2U2_NEPPI|nr:hypothetical protein NPIL_243271 [Nephila pilipes]
MQDHSLPRSIVPMVHVCKQTCINKKDTLSILSNKIGSLTRRHMSEKVSCTMDCQDSGHKYGFPQDCSRKKRACSSALDEKRGKELFQK